MRTQIYSKAVGPSTSADFPSTFLRHARSLSLDGNWLIKDETPGDGVKRRYFTVDTGEAGWVPAVVPCSVQTAYLERQRIPDPYYGRNNLECLWMEEREWWLRKRFVLPRDWEGSTILLAFEGIDYWGDFWLNGQPLGFHEGMFGGPFFIVSDTLTPGEENVLVVKLDPAPRNWRQHLKNTVSYGWHYGRYVTAGIWQSVHLIGCDSVLVENAAAIPLKVSSREALLEVRLDVWCFEKSAGAVLSGRIQGKNFDGKHLIKKRVSLHNGRNRVRLRVPLADPQLWWPSNLGSQNLYECKLRAYPAGSRQPEKAGPPGAEGASHLLTLDEVSFTFGIRTVETLPARDRKKGDYRWIFRINGKKVFIKGANWCFLDALLRFPEERYRRVLAMAKEAGINLLRVWGGGIVETERFYDLCDEMGIMVWQEFPLTHPVSVGRNGPAEVSLAVLREQAGHILRRFRNRASLVVWAGGNEHGGRGEAIHLLEKLCRRLDPSKPFHRASPYGGDNHDWGVYHRFGAVTDYSKNTTPFLSEFGLPCPPQIESLQRFLPPQERTTWPPQYGGSFLHHVPEYGASPDMAKMLRYANQYGDIESMERFTRYMQTSQAVALRTGIEHLLSGMLDSTGGVLIYKLGENAPGISWSVIDWFGLPKPGYYFVKRAFEPVHIFCRYHQTTWFTGSDFKADVLVARSGGAEGPYHAQAIIYGSDLLPLHGEECPIPSLPEGVRCVLSLSRQVPDQGAAPFFLHLRLTDRSGACVSEDVYWYNFDNTLAHQTSWRERFDDFSSRMGCLNHLPRTSLTVHSSFPGSKGPASHRRIGFLVKNGGSYPSFLTNLSCCGSDPSVESAIRYSDNDFWLPAGDAKTVIITLDGPVCGDLIVKAQSWNAPPSTSTLKLPPGDGFPGSRNPGNVIAGDGNPGDGIPAG